MATSTVGLKARYDEEIRKAIMERFQIENPMAAPRLAKIVVNRGVGKALENAKRLESAQKELALISGQWPKLCRARKSISNFKLREHNAIGCAVTLRRDRMYEFLERLICVVIPRIRDFRGLPRTSFDGRGNYSFGTSGVPTQVWDWLNGDADGACGQDLAAVFFVLLGEELGAGH